MSSLSLPWDEQGGQPQNINHVMENDEALRDKINGNLDADNLTPAEAAKLGLSAGTTIRRGKSIIATEEARTNTAYGLMATPDRVSGIVLPTDGLICVAYTALWKSSVLNAGLAAIFVGANQLRVPSSAVAVQEVIGTTANVYHNLYTQGKGLSSQGSGTDMIDPATTGQILGTGDGTGPVAIFAAAGTYDVSVQFKASSGSVTAKHRKLWVWTIGL